MGRTSKKVDYYDLRIKFDLLLKKDRLVVFNSIEAIGEKLNVSKVDISRLFHLFKIRLVDLRQDAILQYFLKLEYWNEEKILQDLQMGKTNLQRTIRSLYGLSFREFKKLYQKEVS